MIIPSLHRILVKPDKVEEVDQTMVRARSMGLEIPLTEDTRSRAQAGIDRGTVVAVGATAFKDFGTSSPISSGDYIAYARFAGKIIKDPSTEEEFVIINDEDLVCVFIQE